MLTPEDPPTPEPAVEEDAALDEELVYPEAEEVKPKSLLQTRPKGHPAERPCTITGPQVLVPDHPDLTAEAWRTILRKADEGSVKHRPGAPRTDEREDILAKLQTCVDWQQQDKLRKKSAFYM